MGQSQLRSQSILPQRISEHNSQHSPLLLLPAELHNQIYNYLIPRGKVRRTTTMGNWVPREGKTLLDLVLLCQQVYVEATPIIYSKAVFELSTLQHISHWLMARSPVQLVAIKLLTIQPDHLRDFDTQEAGTKERHPGLAKLFLLERDVRHKCGGWIEDLRDGMRELRVEAVVAMYQWDCDCSSFLDVLGLEILEDGITYRSIGNKARNGKWTI
ncbi:hypothetical protein P154DRAFT_575292 [Amniculicola lignicola CBS 123094]|uniref:DUF7730 domain-containing protein n=1 Tax=Amniculicola lignicola CBS 123094 TaxID=1392246 RepID=A0A6A5WQ65_9PLEO|nr:hypothetical protein P154DRAFT_575292 [Amniculicola lignicola CBS 123094]